MRYRPKPKKTPDPYLWHFWFAWHPVKVKDTWVWLETVERRVTRPSEGWPTGSRSWHWRRPKWQYALRGMSFFC